MRVVLAGGGTAGHIEPALALADALRQADPSIGVTCIGTERGLETRLVPLRGYELELIPAVPLPRSVTPRLLTVPGRLAGAVHATGAILDRVGADVLVGFGGYVATPAYLAAKRHKVPIVVHEANPYPGIANRLGAHLTTHVFTGHPDTKLRNGTYLGLPIRREIAELDRFARGDSARAYFGLRRDLPVLLVFGGSQGARSLNLALAGALDAIRNVGVQVLHVTGPKNTDSAPPPGGITSSPSVPYVAVPYVDEMDLAYAAADFALCRAGANTCAELTAVGLPAAYVPLPIGNGEQRLNAQPIVARGGGMLVDDAELSAEWIRSSLLPVLTDIDQVAAMSEAAAAMGRKDADRWLAKAVMDVVAAEPVHRGAEPGQPAGGQFTPRHRQTRLSTIFREGGAMALVTPTEPVPLAELGRVHFAGIGGAGMSGIARIMLARGVSVSGSDSSASAVLAELAALGARVHVGQAAGQLGAADTLVVSSAIRADNPELVEAGARGLRVLHRAAALASLMIGRRVIAVTGTHGKTTTTSMVTTVLLETGADPAYAIGGVLAATGTGAADGAGRDFVAEADESDGSFLMYSPDAAVVTNVEADHLDNYGTTLAYRASFAAFLRRIKPGGLLVTCADDPGARDLAAKAAALGLRVVTYGESADADYRVSRVRASGMETSFTIGAPRPAADPGNGAERPSAGPSRPGPFRMMDFDLALRVPGRHYALDAAAAFAVTVELGLEPARAAAALARYRGAARRLEPKGEAGGVRVLDSYAHHPTELAADLRAARAITAGAGRVIAVFQPHLFSRTRLFAAEFGAALGLADEAVILDVYAAREDPEPGVTGRLVADAVPGGAARYVPLFADVPVVVAALAAPGDLVLTMGAGDITRMGPLVLDEITASVATAGGPGGPGGSRS